MHSGGDWAHGAFLLISGLILTGRASRGYLEDPLQGGPSPVNTHRCFLSLQKSALQSRHRNRPVSPSVIQAPKPGLA